MRKRPASYSIYLRRPMPPMLGWFLTFLFVNVTWVFFRAKTMDDAMRVLNGMSDVNSFFNHAVSSTQVADLAWAGWLSDIALRIMPVSLIGQLPIYMAIIAAFTIIAQKNSLEMASGTIGKWRLAYGGILFIVAMYFMLAATSSVFLYFNF